MHVLIIGAAGMVGRKLTERLAKEGHLGKHAIERMTLHDVIEPPSPEAVSICGPGARLRLLRCRRGGRDWWLDGRTPRRRVLDHTAYQLRYPKGYQRTAVVRL